MEFRVTCRSSRSTLHTDCVCMRRAFFQPILNWKRTRKNVHVIEMESYGFTVRHRLNRKVPSDLPYSTYVHCIHTSARTHSTACISRNTQRNPSPNFFRVNELESFSRLFHSLQLNHLLLSAFAVWPKYSDSEIKFELRCLRFMSKLTARKELKSESHTFLFLAFSFFYVSATTDIYLHRQLVMIFLESVCFLFKHIVF